MPEHLSGALILYIQGSLKKLYSSSFFFTRQSPHMHLRVTWDSRDIHSRVIIQVHTIPYEFIQNHFHVPIPTKISTINLGIQNLSFFPKFISFPLWRHSIVIRGSRDICSTIRNQIYAIANPNFCPISLMYRFQHLSQHVSNLQRDCVLL